MTLLLHAIVPADRASATPLAAVTTTWDERPLTREAMLAHHDLVVRLHAEHEACLPARFPTLLDDDALRDLLTRREADLLASLERVRNRAELAVTALWLDRPEPPAVDSGTPGQRYLRQRQQEFHAADHERAVAAEVAEALARLLEPDVVAAQRKLCPRPDTALSLALLVPRPRAQQLAARLPDIDRQRNVRILVNGPWPPYSFVSLTEGEE